MTKLALIDLDGVLCDSTARFAQAEQAKLDYLAGSHAEASRVSDVYWRTAFTPELVKLDTLIDGAVEAIERIEQAGYEVYFLTSRPETMREATHHWLYEHFADFLWRHALENPGSLIMKPDSQKYVKTVVWKAGVVELLSRLFAADELLFVDDEPAIYETVAMLPLPCEFKVASSLQEALKMVEGKE